MFELPPGGKVEEGLSDDSPIVLRGDKASELRSVLKYMYAGCVFHHLILNSGTNQIFNVMHTQIDKIPLVALPEIMAVATFANKYEMRDWKEWALSYLSRRILQPERTIIFGLSSKGQYRTPLMGLPVWDLAAFHGLYHRLEGNEAYRGLNLIMRVWCVRGVETKELPVSGALDAAAACGDSETLASLYCVQLRRMKGHARMLEPTPFPVDNISPIHFQCMFAGYCSLSLAWDHLRDKAVLFPFVTGTCASDREHWHTTQCIPHYQTRWKDAIHAAEGQCPDVTKMLDRVSSVIQHLRNRRGLKNGKKWECFHDFTRFTGGLSTALQDFN